MIRVIIGLGNPGKKYESTRHNIGFRVLDALAEKYNAQFLQEKNYESATIMFNDRSILLIKPETGMNLSGSVIPLLKKQGFSLDSVLVVHDELEKPFGTLHIRFSGSHRGHNGLRSIMTHGADFWRLRFGISRPDNKEDVPVYVLAPFAAVEQEQLDSRIADAVKLIEEACQKSD